MISVRLQGGLGNQLFQIFTGAALAIRTRRQLVCRHIDGNRKSYNGIYFHVRDEPNNVRFRDIVEHQGQWFSMLHFPTHGNLRLTGYFQNKNYFEALFDQCAQLIRFQYPKIQDIPGTAIHVRRGDFKNHPTIFELLDLSYYESHLRNAQFKRPWHIVTEAIDDPFVRQLQDQLHIETVHSGPDDFEYLVSHSNIVGANSTFSWWACYLAKRMKPNGHYVVADSFVKGHTGPSL